MISDIIKAIILFFYQIDYWEGKYDASVKAKQSPAEVYNADKQKFDHDLAVHDTNALTLDINAVLPPAGLGGGFGGQDCKNPS